jgi:hypothetical protein
MLFTSIWTLLAVAYLTLAPTRFPRAAHKFAIAAVEFLTMLFWFAAFIAVAVLWRDIYWGWAGHGTVHNVGIAAIVFGAFLWYDSLFDDYQKLILTDPGCSSLLPPFFQRSISATRLAMTPHPHQTWLVSKLDTTLPQPIILIDYDAIGHKDTLANCVQRGVGLLLGRYTQIYVLS